MLAVKTTRRNDKYILYKIMRPFKRFAYIFKIHDYPLVHVAVHLGAAVHGVQVNLAGITDLR